MKPPKSLNSSSRAQDVLSGGGEMGERIRSFDWSRTSLGLIGTWPKVC